ncbi:MAG: hypothetical protein OXI79_17180 [Gammaproteobacteria bacterium]|nr:hypothetical protein [Gammaproteobacteria bacterium]
MSPTNSQRRTLLGVAATLVVLCVVARLLPHPPNFAPATAVALFGCVFFSRRWHAGAVVVLGMIVSDWFIGFYDTGVMLTVYASLLMPLVAQRFLGKSNAVRLGTVAVVSGVGFYLTTNAAVWFFTNAYPPTLDGLAASYLAGLPFLKWTLLGNVFYTAVLFGTYGIVRRSVAGIAQPARA